MSIIDFEEIFERQLNKPTPTIQASIPLINMDKIKESQNRPSLDALDEDVPDAQLQPLNRPSTLGYLRLKTPMWDMGKSHTGSPLQGNSPRRSKRSQSSLGKGHKAQKSKPATRHDRSLDEDVSPTNSEPGSPRLVSHVLNPEKQTLLSTEGAPEPCLSPLQGHSMPIAEAPVVRQPITPPCCQNKETPAKNIFEDVVELSTLVHGEGDRTDRARS